LVVPSLSDVDTHVHAVHANTSWPQLLHSMLHSPVNSMLVLVFRMISATEIIYLTILQHHQLGWTILRHAGHDVSEKS